MYMCIECTAKFPIYTDWCTSCWLDKTVILAPIMPSSQMRSEMQSISAADLIKREWTLTESKSYPDIVSSNGSIFAVYGLPGMGKSTFATRYLDGLPGNVIYYSAEERLGPTVASRLGRLGIHRKNFHIVAQGSIDALINLCREEKAIGLVIDSIQLTTIQPNDLRRLLESSGVGVMMFLLQARKDAKAAGSNAFLHEADVVVKVEHMRWEIEKSRYQELTGGFVLKERESDSENP